MPTRTENEFETGLTWNLRTTAAAIIFIFVLGLILRLARAVLFPFAIALFLSFILAPALDFLIRLKIPRPVAVAILLLLSFLVLYLLGFLFYNSGKAFADEIPAYGKKFSDLGEYLRQKFHITSLEWDPLGWLTELDMERVARFLVSSLGPFVSFLTNFFLVFVFLVFIMAGHGKVRAKIQRAYSPDQAGQIMVVIDHINKQVQKYLLIKTAINLGIAVLTTVFLVILGLDFAIVFGFLAFLFNYIPNIGTVIASVLPALMAFVQFSNPLPAILILLALFLMQQGMGLLEVRVVGQGLGLSPLLVIFSLVFWGWLWGIPGMILSVPILAVIKIVCFNIPSLRPLAVMMSS